MSFVVPTVLLIVPFIFFIATRWWWWRTGDTTVCLHPLHGKSRLPSMICQISLDKKLLVFE
jgi:hypothetical protein